MTIKEILRCEFEMPPTHMYNVLPSNSQDRSFSESASEMLRSLNICNELRYNPGGGGGGGGVTWVFSGVHTFVIKL